MPSYLVYILIALAIAVATPFAVRALIRRNRRRSAAEIARRIQRDETREMWQQETGANATVPDARAEATGLPIEDAPTEVTPAVEVDPVDPYVEDHAADYVTDADRAVSGSRRLVAQLGITAEREPGRSYSKIPPARGTSGYVDEALVVDSTEHAIAAMREATGSTLVVSERLSMPSDHFDPLAQFRRIKAALTDPDVARAMVGVQPMHAFLLDVPETESTPEFEDARKAFLDGRTPMAVPADYDVIDGETIEMPTWHTGLTCSTPAVPVRTLERVA